MAIKHHFLVGAAKAGTSWVDACLRESKEVALPFRKETEYFSKVSASNYNSYHSLFSSSVLQSTGKTFESCPSYMINERCPERLKNFDPDSKILFIFRDPVERAYSHYCMHYRSGATRKRPEKSIVPGSRYFDDSLYSKHLMCFLEVFPESQIKISLYRDLKDSPIGFFKEICSWLDIKDYQPSLISDRVLAGKSVPKFPKAYKMIVKTLQIMSSKRWGNWFVRYSQRSELSKLFHAINSGGDFPELTTEFALWLRREYLPMIEALEKMTSYDLQEWKAVQA